LFDFKYSICDDKDQEAKTKLKEDRKKELEDRINGVQEQAEDPKAAKKKPDPKAAKKDAKGKGGGAEPAADGTELVIG